MASPESLQERWEETVPPRRVSGQGLLLLANLACMKDKDDFTRTIERALDKSPSVVKKRNVDRPNRVLAKQIADHILLSNWEVKKGEPLDPHGV